MPLEGARVLVIEDNAELARNLGEILGEQGADVRTACTGAEALVLATEPFDVALLDVGLPDAGGLSLLPKLKAKGHNAEVLVITGSASLEDAIQAVTGGAYAYLLKPVDPDHLLTTVFRAVRQVHSSREAEALRGALQRSETRLRTWIDTVQALLIVLDDRGRILQANHAVADATGVPVEELVGRSWNSFVVKSDQETVREAFRGLVRGESPDSHEHRVLRRGGREEDARPVSWRSSLVRDEGGNLRVYASGLDITDLRELERRTRLNEKLAAVGTLSAGLAHEIRNPLNAASLQLRLLERRLRGVDACDDRVREPMVLVQEELSRLSHLVGDFLLFARPSELQTEELNLAALVKQVLDLERPAMEERGIEITSRIPSRALNVVGDREKLRQVLLNLLRNATEALGTAGAIEVALSRRGRGARVVVRDTGPGIPDAHLTRVFEPFFSTKPGGTGLGMAIVHSLVSQHGGEVTLRVQGGTCVEIDLPRSPPGFVAPKRRVS